MLTVLLLGLVTAREAQAFYNPSTGRWLSRDPIGERGGQNQYAFVGNKAIDSIDFLGLRKLRPSCKCCCECAESIVISNPQVRTNISGSVGHIFWVDIQLSYREVSRPFCPEPPKFKWEEKSNRPPKWLQDKGAKPNEWYDAFEIDPATQDDKWKNRNTTCSSTNRTVATGDFPAADLNLGKRTLQFRLSVINPPACFCPQPVVTATAVQIIDPKAPPIFQIPDPNK